MKKASLIIFIPLAIYYLTILIFPQRIKAESFKYYELKANKAYKNGDYDKAIFYFSKAIEINPKAVNSYIGRCGMKINIGEYQ